MPPPQSPGSYCVSYRFCGRVCSQLCLEGVSRHYSAIPVLIDCQEALSRLNASDMDGLGWTPYEYLSAYGDFTIQVFTPGRCPHLMACAIFFIGFSAPHTVRYHQNLWSRFELASPLPISNQLLRWDNNTVGLRYWHSCLATALTTLPFEYVPPRRYCSRRGLCAEGSGVATTPWVFSRPWLISSSFREGEPIQYRTVCCRRTVRFSVII